MSSLLCPLCNAPQTAESIEAHANHCLDAANSAPAPAGAPNPAASVVSELRNSGPVVDLMVTLLCAAASGEKRNVHPDPAWPNSPASLAFRNPLTFDQRTTFTPFPFGIGFGVAGGERNIDLLLTTIDQIPAISVLQQHDSDEQLKAALDAISPLCFPLLSWIVHNQHTRLTLLPAGRHFAQMQTPWQFQAASLAQEQRFQQSRQRAQNRSFSEFYGAPITDWHSFLRSGPSVDAAKGGIGLANTGHNAYSSLGVGLIHGRAWRNSQFHGNSDMCCLALMEVADMRHAQRLVDQNLIRGNDTTPAMLATESSLVAPRYLFFYPTGAPWIAHPADARYVNPSTPVAADLHAK